MFALIDPIKYGEHFYDVFSLNSRRQFQNDRKYHTKLKNKDKNYVAPILDVNFDRRIGNPLNPLLIKEQSLLCPAYPVAHIALQPNASYFAIFSLIRSVVLEAETRRLVLYETKRISNNLTYCCSLCVGTCTIGGLMECTCHFTSINTFTAANEAAAAGVSDSNNAVCVNTMNEKRYIRDSANSDGDSEPEECNEKNVKLKVVPLIVGAGLRSLFELISEARHVQPTLCSKALKAMLDVIQGQEPESFKQEPEDLINVLYDLLLDLTTMSPTNVTEEDWSAMACSALVGLCIARGDTGQMLKAIATMLMAPYQLTIQQIQMPTVLHMLQRTVISAVLGKPFSSDIYNDKGITQNSLVDEFCVNVSYSGTSKSALASDGTYLYLLVGGGLYKIGSGYNNSSKGHIYSQNLEFTKEKLGWLGYCGGQLYYRRKTKRNTDHIHLVNTETLIITSMSSLNMLPLRDGNTYTLFTDDTYLNAICSNGDDTLVVKQLNISSQQREDHDMAPPSELPLQLSRKRFRTLGYAVFEEEILNHNQILKIQSSYNHFEPKISHEIQNIICGKEFGLVCTTNGKVYYYGKAAALGLKSIERTPIMKLSELIISNTSRVVNVSSGHDGIHALLVNEDGSVYIVGTARRGEDGDLSKNRRQPKAVKPKKLTKIDGHFIVQSACNNGTSAFVTKTGKLIMYGKDTMHCDALGFVSDFSDQHIQKVALGKAHCVALNAKGQVFTFGLNNKGQCGYVFPKVKDSTHVEAKTLGIMKKLKSDFSNLCDYDDHNMTQGQCRICVLCKECTGYNVSCVALNVSLESRVPGALCACGHGDAGCCKCGLCSSCIAIQETECVSDVKDTIKQINRQRSKCLLVRRKDKKLSDDLNTNTEDNSPRVAPLPPQLLHIPSSSPVVQVACGLHHTVLLTMAGEVFTFGSNQFGQLGTGDLQAVTGPVRVNVTGQACPVPIRQVAAGSNHTVLLTYKGLVYTFGNYQKGQLGRMPHDTQNNHNMPISGERVDRKNDGSSIEELIENCTKTTESTTVAQLLAQRQKILWHCTPGLVFGIGPSFGKKAIWIGASGDQTFIKIDESLITTQMLSKIHVIANKKTILMIPAIPFNFQIIAINRRDGSCTAHNYNQVDFCKFENVVNKQKNVPEVNQNIDENLMSLASGSSSVVNEQMLRSMHEARNELFDLHNNQRHNSVSLSSKRDQRKEHTQDLDNAMVPDIATAGSSLFNDKFYSKLSFALDPLYNVLWVYDSNNKNFLCYNMLASEIKLKNQANSNYETLLAPELSLPCKLECRITRLQASLNLLRCLDVLTSAQDTIPSCFEDVIPKQENQNKEIKNNQYQIVNRFDNFGGGWGYSGHSVEAIRFSTDKDIMIYGFGMFGGRGEYSCKIKLYDLGLDGGDYEKDGSLITETKEIPFECPSRSMHHILLSKPVNIIGGKWYLVLARISGPSSDCGSCGHSTVTTEDMVVFTFKTSKKANNGTDVNSGQIPAILYRSVTLESKQPLIMADVEPVKRVTNNFANTVTKECFESLVLLLNWSWDTFKGHLREQRDMSDQLQVKQLIQYLKHVNKCCLRLLRKYTNEIYPKLGSIDNINDEYLSKVLSGTNNSKKYHKSTIFKNDSEISGVGQNRNNVRTFNMENVQLAECIGNVRAIFISILCDDIFQDIWNEETYFTAMEILEECHISFESCFGVFYPTSTLKWNCLCESLYEIDKQGASLNSYLLSAILAGLCSPTIKLRSIFALFYNGSNERQSNISPSDNFGLPMLSLADSHQYPILVEQMIYRTQQEKTGFINNTWTFRDVLTRLLNIIANPIQDKIESLHNRHIRNNYSSWSHGNRGFYQGLIDNCCNLLSRVLAEIVYQLALGDYDKMYVPPRTLHSSGCRFSRCDQRRTWSTGNFGPDAIAFTVDRCGIAVAGATIYSGSGSYEYQLDLLYDNSAVDQPLQQQHQQAQNKWETLESIAGTYDQSVVHNRMVEIKFERSVLIKENTRYALRICSQGARTCSGDGGMPSVRGPCGTIFHFYACDLSFNGTNAQRGQIPCILYYSTPLNQDNNYLPGTTGLAALNANNDNSNISSNEYAMRDTALQIATDINKKCLELLILARNTLAASLSPSDNSSNHSPTMDSEHNITPIEEHMDINWVNNSRTSALSSDDRGSSMSTARDLSKRLESFSKGIIETLKFEKRSTNPFEMEIEIGSTEFHSNDLIIEESNSIQELDQITKLNGNEGVPAEAIECYTSNSQYNTMGRKLIGNSEEVSAQIAITQVLDIFSCRSSNLFHTLLPLVYAHIANLACSDAKSSVHILGLIKDILPHVASLNQLQIAKGLHGVDYSIPPVVPSLRRLNELQPQLRRNEEDLKNGKPLYNEMAIDNLNGPFNDLPTTSKHYCIVESEHPYRSASVQCYRVEFPPCVQWLTIEFDGQCGTAQLEDCLLVSIPTKPLIHNDKHCQVCENFYDSLDNNIKRSADHAEKNVLLKTCYELPDWADLKVKSNPDWVVIKKFNTPSKWLQNLMIVPGNYVEFILETSSNYAQDPNANRYGFKCLVVGYDNPIMLNENNTCLLGIEQELAYLGGMCSANLMNKSLNLPDDKDVTDLSCINETINSHFALLSKGLAITQPELTIHQALESHLSIGSQSNERQFLKDFISGAPGSSGARLAAWLQPEPRLDPNKCEMSAITEPIRSGWPTQITIVIRDQYGDAIVVPELKVEVKASPASGLNNDNVCNHRTTQRENGYGDVGPPPRLNYESTIKENMRFKAITFMKSYHNYSFEELRYNNPVTNRVTETLYAQDMEDGTFCVCWTPNTIGSYCLTVIIDNILLEEVHRVEVKEGNVPPPSQKRFAKSSRTSNKLRRFYTESTAGLRIRSHPTLQSEQVGIIKLNGIILFIDEIENDDGVWLRLSTESIRQHCTIGWYPTEAWCLQYNQHFNKILLHPVIENTTSISTNYPDSTTEPKQLNSPSIIRTMENELKSMHQEADTATLKLPPVNQGVSKSDSPKKSAFDFPSDSYSKSIGEQSTVSTNPFLRSDSPIDKTFTVSQFHTIMGSKGCEISDRTEDMFSSSMTGSTNVIGSAIAGVMGGGAIKLQALQKWFKGDTLNEPSCGRENQPIKRTDVGDIASVSVRELVRAMGGHDSKSNGSNSSPQRRSSSPLPIPSNKSINSSNSIRKPNSNLVSCGTTCSNTSGPQNNVSYFDVANMRKTNFTPSQAAALLSTPKHSPRRNSSGRKIALHAKASTSSEKNLTETSNFVNLEDDVGLLEVTTTTTISDQKILNEIHTTCSTASTDHSSPPLWPEPIECNSLDGQIPKVQQKSFFKTTGSTKKKVMGPIKRGMPPSFAESTRAVFAAFVWHEGIVHDAMACASFLKFHPNLPKEGAMVITRREHGNTEQQLSREEKAQQRHSVEVVSAGNYLNLRPSTLETLTKSGNFTLHNRKHRKSQSNDEKNDNENCDKIKLQSLPEIVTVLPPALRSLVYLWEHISKNCMQMAQYNSINQDKIGTCREHSGESIKSNRPSVKESKRTKKKKEDEAWCEICQIFLPIPVTYHMRMVHPGCSKSAKGNGYNSVGIYCEGWAGNCGEGGKGAANWFIMCESCRDKYLSTNKSINNLNNTNTTEKCDEFNFFSVKDTSVNAESYTTLRENATFLLELSSNLLNLPSEVMLNSGPSINNSTKKSPQQMPVVMEHRHFNHSDINKPSTSRRASIRCNRLKFNGKNGSSYRKSSGLPEQPWLAPETFAYLDTFRSYNQEDMPYEVFGLDTNGTCIDRPLSDVSHDLSETLINDVSGNKNNTKNSNTLSKFHRSFSMGQGWGVVQQQQQFNSNWRQEDTYYSKVICQRRYNSSSDSEGSLLICYPSENLKRLVPDHILVATSAVHQYNTEDKTNRTNSEVETPSGEDTLLQRPSLKFVMQKHDLKKLRNVMKRSLRIATCRNYSLQALNWLLHSVTQNVCLHDLMWWFVSSLSTSSSSNSDLFDDKYDDAELALEHPVSYIQISGRLSHLVTDSLHKFLQSVADLTLYLPLGSPLQQIAVQCFGIRFRQSDHQFLHSSHVFNNISKILSKSDEQNECSNILSQNDSTLPNGACNGEQNIIGGNLEIGGKIVYFTDLNGHFDITASSRQRMVETLIDNSTETFWESDEEDRNKNKIIEITMNKLDYYCKMLLVHIDNSRDIQCKVSNVTFYGGSSLSELSLIKSIDVDVKCCSWLTVKIHEENFTHFRLEFSGTENTLRVRQIKLLGLPTCMCQKTSHKYGSYDLLNNTNLISTQLLKNNFKLSNAKHIQHQMCESETLRVFRLITSQVFGKLISMESAGEEGTLMNKNSSQNPLGMDLSANSILADSLDLREHMVGILFSRSKLSHLQKQVIVHIVYAIKREARRAREDWEAANLNDNLKENTSISNSQDNKSEITSDRNHFGDTYCFEMLSMVLALSGSVVGRSYLSHQHGLIKDILTLLHTGSDRVQRQVTALLRRILPEISPTTFGGILGVHKLPQIDYNIANQIGVDFDMNNLGLLDIFLAVIAKALQLQIKFKNVASKSIAEKPTLSLLRLNNVLDLSIHLLKPLKQSTPLEGVSLSIDDTFSCNNYTFADYKPFSRDIKPESSEGPQKNLNQRWFLKGIIPSKQAESIISLIKDLTAGKLGDKWSQTTKAAIAETILNLTRLDDVFRTPDNCIKTATLWLALASLCVLNNEHVEKLSSGQWAISETRPMCSNHDDGETAAMIQCDSCGSLCGDCDRFLHLNRKTRTHKRTVCKEEEEAIRVELHESCGRIKLFWLLALADSRTLKSIVEFRDGNHAIISNTQESVGRCRFCGIIGNSGLLEIGNVCADVQCQEHAANACMKTKPCGHPCGGVVNEKKCLPCLHHICQARQNEITDGPKLTQDADDMCMICFIEALACAPSLQLGCGHVFHYHCCKTVLEKRWNGPRITFSFSLCPICKTDIDHPMLADILEPINLLKQDVKRKALIRIKYEGLVLDRDDRDLTSLAMDRYAYYVCFKCQKAYYGGEARCDAEIGEHFNPQELVCGGCSDVARAQMCPKHGTDFLEYKCRYCCSVAVYFCFGTTHFCNACHDGFQNVTNIPKNKLPQCPAGPKGEQLMGDECPLHVLHPPTGEEFALGCGICRKAQTF